MFAAPAFVAVAAMLCAPAQAASLPVPGKTEVAALGEMSASNHRYYYRYRRGPSAGDVLAGILIIGGIAAVADAATRSSRDDRYRDRGYPAPPYRGGGYGYDDERGIDQAVSRCIAAVERDGRIRSVDYAERTARGWQIRGAMANGSAFNCSLGADGRIENLDIGGRPQLYRGRDGEGDDYGRAEPYRGSDRDDERYEGDGWQQGARDDDGRYAGEDRQYDDDRYAQAWAEHDAGGAAPAPLPAPESEEAQPAYPGGPLPGESPEGAEPIVGQSV